jgi:hypothetical protein
MFVAAAAIIIIIIIIIIKANIKDIPVTGFGSL